MGNSSSKETIEITSLASQIDDIAINYILNQNTIDLLRLTDKEYYDNLIILTSDVINKKLNGLELGFLNNRIFGKKTISDIIDVIPSNNKLKDKVIFNISKFYIKIIMIYSAIATTIDPQYSYEDENGNKKTFYLKDINEYKNIPKNVKPMLVQLTNPMNLCRKRLDILKNKLDLNVDDTYIKINPGEKLCSLTTTSKLTDEIGIKELDTLYYDIFDYETKTWNKRSKKMKEKYNKDLILFYQIFTGKEKKPIEIQTFQDIELLDMSKLDYCNNITFMQDILVDKKNALIQKYIEKINNIEKTTQKYRAKLLDILKELFVIKVNDNERKYTLNPELTLDNILMLETETRDTILNLYASCEKNFIQALIIFERIYNEQVKQLNNDRINYIEKIKTPPPDVIEPSPEPLNYEMNNFENSSKPQTFDTPYSQSFIPDSSITDSSIPVSTIEPSETISEVTPIQGSTPIQTTLPSVSLDSVSNSTSYSIPSSLSVQPMQSVQMQPVPVVQNTVPMQSVPVQPIQSVPMQSVTTQPIQSVPMQSVPLQPMQTVPMQSVPVQQVQPIQSVPVQNTLPLQPVPVQNTVPMQSVPVQNTVPMQSVPVQNTVPMQSVPVQNTLPMQSVPVENTLPLQPVPVQNTVPMQPTPTSQNTTPSIQNTTPIESSNTTTSDQSLTPINSSVPQNKTDILSNSNYVNKDIKLKPQNSIPETKNDIPSSEPTKQSQEFSFFKIFNGTSNKKNATTNSNTEQKPINPVISEKKPETQNSNSQDEIKDDDTEPYTGEFNNDKGDEIDKNKIKVL